VSTPFILKVDTRGSVLWQRKLGQDNEEAMDVELDNHGNLIVVSTVGTGEESRIRIFRLTQAGVGVDSAIIDSDEWQVAQSVTPVSNGTFMISGYAGPDFVFMNENGLVGDENDVLVYRIDEQFLDPQPLFEQGGQRVGKNIKVLPSSRGTDKFLIFGDSDSPLIDGGAFRQKFEVLLKDEFNLVVSKGPETGLVSQTQVASYAIETPRFEQNAYLLVGSTFNGAYSDIFFAQYLDDNKDLTIRVSKSLPFGRKMEGVSAAVGLDDTFFILANEFQDNSNRDIFLVKVQGDGEVIGRARFGSLEGDDSAGAIQILADGRIAVLGTLQLETQKKMVLIVLSPDGNFTNG
jgi:hypothetical protein